MTNYESEEWETFTGSVEVDLAGGFVVIIEDRRMAVISRIKSSIVDGVLVDLDEPTKEATNDDYKLMILYHLTKYVMRYYSLCAYYGINYKTPYEEGHMSPEEIEEIEEIVERNLLDNQ